MNIIVRSSFKVVFLKKEKKKKKYLQILWTVHETY